MEPPENPGKLRLWLHDIVSALSYSSCTSAVLRGDPRLAEPYNDVTTFVLRQLFQMPDLLRAPMMAAAAGFDLAGIARAGRLFHTQAPANREKQIRAWKESKLAFRRDLVRYFETLSVFGLHSREEESAPVSPRNSEWPKGTITTSPETVTRCQVAVVGSGPGGALTACLLAEAGRDVVMVEEGPFIAPEDCAPFSRAEMLTKYRHGGQTVALGKNKIAYVEGRCVGGGSEINSGLYHRTPPEILELWRKRYKVAALESDDMEPYFAANESELSVSPLPGPAPLASVKLAQGAERLGWKSIETPRWHRYLPGNSAGGERQTMTRTFIPRFLRAGGKLLPLTRVERLRQENGRWVLSLLTERGQTDLSTETVFVAAGAVQTPALLHRSGIKRNIGNALKVHPTVKLTAQFPDPVNSSDMGVPVHQVKEFAPSLTLGCSISSRPYLALGLLGYPEALREVTEKWAHLANYYAMAAGEGSGTVRVMPGFRAPLVRYQVSAGERADLAHGLRRLAQALFASGADLLYPAIAGTQPWKSMDDLASLPKAIPHGAGNLMTIHLFCSCPMGEDRTRCATDSFGRLHGLTNLRVADASLLCSSPGVNPQGTVMALARRNAMEFLR